MADDNIEINKAEMDNVEIDKEEMGNIEINVDLISRMNERYPKMSKGQKNLAAYITSNYDTAVFMTAAKFGEMVGVSESTTERIATL